MSQKSPEKSQESPVPERTSSTTITIKKKHLTVDFDKIDQKLQKYKRKPLTEEQKKAKRVNAQAKRRAKNDEK